MSEADNTLQDAKRYSTAEVVAGIVLLVIFLTVAAVRFGLNIAQADPGFAAMTGEERYLWFMREFGVVLAAGLTLTMYSFLYRDNALFKLAENLYVGVALGYGAVMTWYLSLKVEIYDPLFGDLPAGSPPDTRLWNVLERAIPIALGCMLVTRISRRFSWPSRYSYAIMIGWGAGIGIPVTVKTFVLKQLEAAVLPLKFGAISEAWNAEVFSYSDFLWALAMPVGGVMILVGTVSVLYYFFFSVERGPVGKVVSRVGIFFLMVSFGASFGYTVMGRISLFIDRVEFLLGNWLKLL